MPEFFEVRNRPGYPRRTWPVGKPYDYDPAYDVLHLCARCGRKTDTTLFGTLRLWRVKPVVPARSFYFGSRMEAPESEGRPLWNVAEIVCPDQAACAAYIEERETKKREAYQRRHPPLPHAGAGAGRCKWCGGEIRFDETKDGWKRRRSRGYHRGDEWEAGSEDCLALARIWLEPRAAEQQLLARQNGRCAVCAEEIAKLGPCSSWFTQQTGETERWGILPPSLGGPDGTAVDHILPVVDGGENTLDNLQVICQKPCHDAKTAREARARARKRRAKREDQLQLA